MGYLEEEELNRLCEKEFKIKRVEQVRDIFVFCCYTGLAYSDVKTLSNDNIIKGMDGKDWIKKKRVKTDILSSIPLLPIAKEILTKYKDHPACLKKDVLLPVLSNQKMNSYLKEIADLCEIEKNLTMHLSRHTFATTVTLANRVSMESVSKMLGHSNLLMTKKYARIVDKIISEDMSDLEARLELKSKQV